MRTGSGMHVSGAGTAVRAALCKFGDLRGTAAAAEQSAIMSMQVWPLCNWLCSCTSCSCVWILLRQLCLLPQQYRPQQTYILHISGIASAMGTNLRVSACTWAHTTNHHTAKDRGLLHVSVHV